MSIPVNAQNRAGTTVSTVLDGKFLIVDGLIVPGNSGGPVLLAGGIRVARDAKTNQLEFSSIPVKNLVIGIVSLGLRGGLTAVVSSDYVLDLLKSIPPKHA